MVWPPHPWLSAFSFLSRHYTAHPHQVWPFPPWCQVPLLQCRLPELWHEFVAQPGTALEAELAHGDEVFVLPSGCDPSWTGAEGLICLDFEMCLPEEDLEIKCNDHPLSRHPIKRDKALRWTTGRLRMEVAGLTCSALDIRGRILLRDFWEKHQRRFFAWRQFSASEEEDKIEGNDQILWKERTLKSVRRKALRNQDISKYGKWQMPWEDTLRDQSRLLPQSIN